MAAGSTNQPPSSGRSSSAAACSASSASATAGGGRVGEQGIGRGSRRKHRAPPREGGRRRRPRRRVQRERLGDERRRPLGRRGHPRQLLGLAERALLGLEPLAGDRAARRLEDARLVVEDQRAEPQPASEPALEDDPGRARPGAVDAREPRGGGALRLAADERAGERPRLGGGPRGQRDARLGEAVQLPPRALARVLARRLLREAPQQRRRRGAVAPAQLAQRGLEVRGGAAGEIGQRPAAQRGLEGALDHEAVKPRQGRACRGSRPVACRRARRRSARSRRRAARRAARPGRRLARPSSARKR